jgi:hypothetical protein
MLIPKFPLPQPDKGTTVRYGISGAGAIFRYATASKQTRFFVLSSHGLFVLTQHLFGFGAGDQHLSGLRAVQRSDDAAAFHQV